MQATIMQCSVGKVAAKAQQLQNPNVVSGTPLVGRRPAQARKTGRIVTTASGIEIPPIKKLDEPEINDGVNAIRFLSIDGVNCAKSGHPGLPMGCVITILDFYHSASMCELRGV
jgi:hypothetical protein